jgi:FAD/FMN-containing dehydrogenase
VTALHPESETQLIDALRQSAADDRPVRIRGGAVSGRAPGGNALDLRLDRLRGVTEHRPADLVVTAWAGTSLVDLDAALAAHGQRLPIRAHDVEGRGTLGGLVAAAADGLLGTQARRVRDVVLGVSAVLADGDPIRVGARVMKSVAGFDVSKALVGSRGVLAAITAVTCRVESRLDPVAVLSGRFDHVDAAERAVHAADAEGLQPRGLGCVRDPHGELQVAAQFEGPGLEAIAGRLENVGLRRKQDYPLAKWTEHVGRAQERHVETCSRVHPLAAARQHAPDDRQSADLWIVADVLRQRRWSTVAVTPPQQSPLWTSVRAAFDPRNRLQPGRGLGAP